MLVHMQPLAHGVFKLLIVGSEERLPGEDSPGLAAPRHLLGPPSGAPPGTEGPLG